MSISYFAPNAFGYTFSSKSTLTRTRNGHCGWHQCYCASNDPALLLSLSRQQLFIQMDISNMQGFHYSFIIQTMKLQCPTPKAQQLCQQFALHHASLTASPTCNQDNIYHALTNNSDVVYTRLLQGGISHRNTI